MNASVRRWAQQGFRILDPLFAPLAAAAGLLLKAFRLVGAQRLPLTRDTLRGLGVFPVIQHYYEPLFDARPIRDKLGIPRALPGVRMEADRQLELLRQLTFAEEIRTSIGGEPFPVASSYGPGDAEFLYQFIRWLKPKRVVEVGCGVSTKVLIRALAANQERDGRAGKHTCIEPYEAPWLDQTSGVSVLRQTLEACEKSVFDLLERGDFLFIDSSHVIRPQGDVLRAYLEILPSLHPGVYIHVHDVFTPRDYPAEWMCDRVRMWNEQYLLEALLTDSSRYRVVAALNFLKHSHFDELRRVCPLLDKEREPGSFYIERT